MKHFKSRFGMDSTQYEIYIDCTTFGFLVEQLNQGKFVYEDEI